MQDSASHQSRNGKTGSGGCTSAQKTSSALSPTTLRVDIPPDALTAIHAAIEATLAPSSFCLQEVMLTDEQELNDTVPIMLNFKSPTPTTHWNIGGFVRLHVRRSTCLRNSARYKPGLSTALVSISDIVADMFTRAQPVAHISVIVDGNSVMHIGNNSAKGAYCYAIILDSRKNSAPETEPVKDNHLEMATAAAQQMAAILEGSNNCMRQLISSLTERVASAEASVTEHADAIEVLESSLRWNRRLTGLLFLILSIWALSVPQHA